MSTLLAQIRSVLTVDVDSMDPTVAARHTTDAVKFCDMTSNQAIVHTEAANPARASIFKAACDRARNPALDLEQQVSDALDVLVRRRSAFLG